MALVIQSPHLRGNRISAQIEGLGTPLPRELWFEFDRPADLWVSSDPFLVTLLLVAMQAGESIEVRGPISARLLEGLRKYQEVYARWFPYRFKIVPIHAAHVTSTVRSSRRIACAFSGGVDSFYSWLELEPRGLTDALFVAEGFDMPSRFPNSVAELRRGYAHLAKARGVNLHTAATNAREFVDTVEWTNAHGQVLAGAALCLGGTLGEFYIPSSYVSSPAWGTHPELDPLLSTESLQFVHHAGTLNRVQKLARVASDPDARRLLRVCWIQDIGLRNCGACEKCVRTQAALEILGARNRFETFPALSRFELLRRLACLPYRTHQSRVFARELFREAWLRRRPSVAGAIALGLLRRQVRRILTSTRR